MKNISIKQVSVFAAIFIFGILAGKFFFSGTSRPAENQTGHSEKTAGFWTCSMHPQIRLPEEGACPLCGMDLIPEKTGGDENSGPFRLAMTESSVRMAGILTQKAKGRPAGKRVRLNGTVRTDEGRIFLQTAHIGGRIEQLDVKFTGEAVKKGQILALVYSPELSAAQGELLEALRFTDSDPGLLAAAREKLRHWKLTAGQIAEIEKNGKIISKIPVRAESGGIVTALNVAVGDHLHEGEVLMSITDFNRLWIVFDAYESDLNYVAVGDPVRFTVSALPGQNLTQK